MKFWDASAIIPLCLQEPRTILLKQLAEEDGAMAAWWASPIECYSAFARLRREEALDSVEEGQARDLVRALMVRWTEVGPSTDVREGAGRALLLHPLRAADSLQLAAALVWAKRQPASHHFVCLDQRLREAAQREGFVILPKRV
jgi:predicted nucleic acid-binding protein